MTNYIRVIPRDLFNEANLLKCYGQLYLNLENTICDYELSNDETSCDGFNVVQDETDGSIRIENIYFFVRGSMVRLMRPLNSRRPYPLYAYAGTLETIAVFEDDGKFTTEMLAFLQRGPE